MKRINNIPSLNSNKHMYASLHNYVARKISLSFLFLLFLTSTYFWGPLENVYIMSVNDSWSGDFSKLNFLGRILWKQKFWVCEEGGCIFSGGGFDWPLVIDLEGDGYYNIIKFMKRGLYGYTHDGREIFNLTEIRGKQFWGDLIVEALPYGDFDGDGSVEVLLASYTLFGYIDPASGTIEKLIELNHTMFTECIYGDFDGDGREEFLATGQDGLYEVDPRNLSIRKIMGACNISSNVSLIVRGWLAPADVDKDGVLEVIFNFFTIFVVFLVR